MMRWAMNLKGRLLGRAPAPQPHTGIERTCAHRTLVPRWDSAADIGDTDAISSFVCNGCKQVFTPEEGRAMTVPGSGQLRRRPTK